MPNYFLHNSLDKASRDFVAGHAAELTDFTVLDWYKGGMKRISGQGLPTPAAFPAVIIELPTHDDVINVADVLTVQSVTGKHVLRPVDSADDLDAQDIIDAELAEAADRVAALGA